MSRDASGDQVVEVDEASRLLDVQLDERADAGEPLPLEMQFSPVSCGDAVRSGSESVLLYQAIENW
ncbi:hypothetical protein [Streptomyces odontomachi]|uniref:hypothetical protein n=1 Tax=Streptomyces odontomachi TaxID=2944940 RepID=UPI00210AB40D|nr:hypothetical protein [Streptomyces sp. ODS25]